MIFIPYDPDQKPQVTRDQATGRNTLSVKIHDPAVGGDLVIDTDLLVLSVAVDEEGDLWFGTDGRGLSRLRSGTQVFDPPFLDFEGLRITALAAEEGRVYVGTDQGISVFLTDKEEV